MLPTIEMQMRGGFDSSLRASYLMPSKVAANKAKKAIVEAMKAWEGRSNEREKFVTIKGLDSEYTLDVTAILIVGVSYNGEKAMRLAAEQHQKVKAIHKGACDHG